MTYRMIFTTDKKGFPYNFGSQVLAYWFLVRFSFPSQLTYRVSRLNPIQLKRIWDRNRDRGDASKVSTTRVPEL